MSGSHDNPAGPSSSGASSSSANATCRSGRQSANEFCSSCMTTTTPVWRRDGQGGLHCNACSLYIKTKGKPRPIHLESYTVKRRRARPTSRQVAGSEGAIAVPIESNHRTISNPTPVAYQDPGMLSRPEDGSYHGARLSMSYPYRGHSAERQSRAIHQHHSKRSSTSLDPSPPPLPVLTTSMSMLETRRLPPLQQRNPSPLYNRQRRDSR